MHRGMPRHGARLLLALLAAACGNGSDADGESAAPLLVLGAFPAERAALVECAAIESTMVIDGRVFRSGRLGGVPVVIGMTGIGLVNATATTRLALDRFAVAGVVVSGVAGSSLRIADVAVPEAWTLAGGGTFAADAAWLEVAAAVAGRAPRLERCTSATVEGVARDVCFAHQPAIYVGGQGRSSDPFAGAALPCQPGAGEVFGCDTDSAGALAAGAEPTFEPHGPNNTPAPPAAEDMESAAVAQEAAARGLPFIAFRAVSDGSGDPLALPGFPAQFFAYYPVAAENAAAATEAFLAALGGNAGR